MRNPNRRHDRVSFFKYMSSDTARKVLAGQSLRWSAPTLFNDPFDVPRELSFGVSADELHRACLTALAMLVSQPPEDVTRYAPSVRLMLELISSGVSEEARAAILTDLADGASHEVPTMNAMNELREIWREWLPTHRILCLTESPKHAAMWYHYADRYRGVVLELLCLDETDSAWLTARPVEYISVN